MIGFFLISSSLEKVSCSCRAFSQASSILINFCIAFNDASKSSSLKSKCFPFVKTEKRHPQSMKYEICCFDPVHYTFNSSFLQEY